MCAFLCEATWVFGKMWVANMLQPQQTYWDHADVHCLSNVQDVSEKELSFNFGKTLIHESLNEQSKCPLRTLEVGQKVI